MNRDAWVVHFYSQLNPLANEECVQRGPQSRTYLVKCIFVRIFNYLVIYVLITLLIGHLIRSSECVSKQTSWSFSSNESNHTVLMLDTIVYSLQGQWYVE